jgi:hypothetical protein
MPPGDLDAARRLAVVWLEPDGGFSHPPRSITAALFKHFPHLQFELVPSGIGATYVRFRTFATREMAMAVPFIMHEGVRITLQREEEAGRTPVRADVCALCIATPLAAEHMTPEGITALFGRFGDVLEIDPICLLGRDMTYAKAVVLMESVRDMPNDIWPKRGPWGARVVEVEVVKVWPLEQAYLDGVYQPFFGSPPRNEHICPGTSAAGACLQHVTQLTTTPVSGLLK